MPTYVLASTIAMLAVADVPLPLELSALAMVGLILRVYIGRENRLNNDRDVRLERLEAARDEQRHLKHMVLNQLAGVTGTLAAARQAAMRCTCGAMVPILPLLDNLLERKEQQ